MKFSRFLLIALFSFCSFISALSQQKIDPLLLEQFAEAPVQEAIIVFKAKAQLDGARYLITKEEKGSFVFNSLRQIARESQAEVRSFLNQKEIPHRVLYIVNAIYLKTDRETINEIAQFEEIAKIQVNPNTSFVKPFPGRDNPGARTVEWGVEKIRAPEVWAMGYTGQGVVVGGQDTGYEWDHPALRAKYRGNDNGNIDHNYNWHDAIRDFSPLHHDTIPDINPCGLDIDAPCDDNNHGTHTMGIIVGSDAENEIGVAPGAKWIGVRNMERTWGSSATYLEGFQWFLAPTDLNNENPDPSKAPHVINNSWSCPTIEGCEPSNFGILEEAVNNLKAAGIVVVVSAGNSGPGCETVNTPAAIFENSFSVGSTKSDDTISGFSSRGPVTVDGSGRAKPNVTAPGHNIRSSTRFGEYKTFSGTSQAGPHVAGLVALMISANPSLAGQVEIIESIIEGTGVPRTSDQECGGVPGTAVPNNTYGHGRMDALAAVNEALLTTNISPLQISNDFNIFPNPAMDQITIFVEDNWNDASFNIYEQDGRQLLSIKNIPTGNLPIDIGNFARGIYIMEVVNKKGKLRGKFVKL